MPYLVKFASAPKSTESVSIVTDRRSKKLHRSFERLEEQKYDLLRSISNWSEVGRRFRPDPQNWSAIDVIDHLARVEQESLATIKANLDKRYPIRIQERIRTRIVFGVMLSPLKIKVPSSVQSVLPGESQVEETIVARWGEVRKDMRLFLDSLQPDRLTCGIFRHPVSGWMTIFDALTFLSVHITHHRYQLSRLHRSFARFRIRVQPCGTERSLSSGLNLHLYF